MFNKVIIVGRATDSPKVEYLRDRKMARICIVNNHSESGKVSFFPVTIWGEGSELAAKYVRKGSKIVIDGNMQYIRSEKEGVKRSFLNINTYSFRLLDAKKDNNNSNNDNDSAPSDHSDENGLY